MAKKDNPHPEECTVLEPVCEIPISENRELPIPLLNAPDSFWSYLHWLIQSLGGDCSSLSEAKAHVLKIFRQRSMGISSRGRYMANQNTHQRNEGDP